MRIKYAITSCNDNPLYYEFWPLVSKVWKELLNIEPILIYIGENVPQKVEESKYGQIIKIKPFSNVPTTSQSQFIRLWYTQKFNDDIVITTDIDMFPLSKWYFHSQLLKIEEDKFVTLYTAPTGCSICYNVASGNTFKEILELDDDFETLLTNYYNSIKNEDRWFVDEIYLTEKLANYKGEKRVQLIRNQMNRINRTLWSYNPSFIKLGLYYDCHSVRPYNKYKEEIDKLMNCIF